MIDKKVLIQEINDAKTILQEAKIIEKYIKLLIDKTDNYTNEVQSLHDSVETIREAEEIVYNAEQDIENLKINDVNQNKKITEAQNNSSTAYSLAQSASNKADNLEMSVSGLAVKVNMNHEDRIKALEENGSGDTSIVELGELSNSPYDSSNTVLNGIKSEGLYHFKYNGISYYMDVKQLSDYDVTMQYMMYFANTQDLFIKTRRIENNSVTIYDAIKLNDSSDNTNIVDLGKITESPENLTNSALDNCLDVNKIYHFVYTSKKYIMTINYPSPVDKWQIIEYYPGNVKHVIARHFKNDVLQSINSFTVPYDSDLSEIKNRLTALEEAGSGGGSQLYKHLVKITYRLNRIAGGSSATTSHINNFCLLTIINNSSETITMDNLFNKLKENCIMNLGVTPLTTNIFNDYNKKVTVSLIYHGANYPGANNEHSIKFQYEYDSTYVRLQLTETGTYSLIYYENSVEQNSEDFTYSLAVNSDTVIPL